MSDTALRPVLASEYQREQFLGVGARLRGVGEGEISFFGVDVKPGVEIIITDVTRGVGDSETIYWRRSTDSEGIEDWVGKVGETFIYNVQLVELPPTQDIPTGFYRMMRTGRRFNSGRIVQVYRGEDGNLYHARVMVPSLKDCTEGSLCYLAEIQSGTMQLLEEWHIENLRNNREWDYKLDVQEYLERICTIVGADASQLDPDAFASCTTESDVNQLLFPMLAERTGDALTEVEKTRLRELFTFDNSREVVQAKERIQSYKEAHDNWMQRAEDKLRDMLQEKQALLKLVEKGGTDIVPAVEEVLASNWYKFDREETFRRADNSLWFVTPPITLRDYNPDAGVDIQVPMGSYRVSLNMQTGVIKVYGHKNNLSYDGHYHPHVASSGTVCWGNAAQVMSSAMEDLRPKDALEALRIILTTYNDESPYATLVDFQQSYEMDGEDPTKESDEEDFDD